jgi:hypothetical protein
MLSISLAGVPNWVAEGPAPITSNSNVIGPTAAQSSQVGAINAIAVDPTNAKHLFAATVNGGIWQTPDFTAATPSWTTTTDLMPSLAIESIAFSPVNSSVIYAGTGSSSSLMIGGNAVGVYRSSNGGATWQIENPNGIFSGLRIIRIIPTTLDYGQTVFAATTDGGGMGGVFRSDDGGTSWTRLSGANGLPSSGVTDLVENPDNANQFFAATSNTFAGANAGVYELDLTGGNTHWVNVTSNITAADRNASLRIELSVSPAGANPVWASIINANGFYQRVYRGVASGGTINWGSVGPLGGGVNQPPDIFTENQGGLHGAICADQTVDNLVYLGGDASNITKAGYIVRGDSTANTWTGLTPIGVAKDPGTVVPASNSDTTAPHADSRSLVFASGGVLLCACDGGVYQATNPRSTSAGAQTWTSINGTIQDTEFYNIAYDSQFHILLGGSQDNGTPSQNAPGSISSYHDESGGDGGATAVDNISLAGRGESARYFFGVIRKIFTGASSRAAGDFDASILPLAGLAGLNNNSPNDLFSFSVVNAVAGRIVIAGGTSATTPVGVLYESSDAGTASEQMVGPTAARVVNDTWTRIPTDDGRITGIAFGSASAIAAGGRSGGVVNPDVLYVASGANIFLRTTAGGTLTATPAQPAGAGRITAIALDPNDWRTAFVTDNTQVFMTSDAGAHWKPITGNLTNPASTSESLAVIPGPGVDAVLFDGSNGVYRMLTSTPGVWSRSGLGLPNTIVGGIVYNASDDVLVVGTVGRGAWEIPNASASLTTPSTLTINLSVGESVTLQRDAGVPQLLDITTTGGSDGNLSIDPRALQQIIINVSDQNQIHLDDLPAGLTATVNGGSASGSVGVEIGGGNLDLVAGQATVHGNGTTTTLTVNDQNDPVVAADHIDATTVSRSQGMTTLPGMIHYDGISTLELDGNGTNTIAIESTGASTSTTVNAGSSTIAVTVSPTARNLDGINHLIVNGGNLTVDDQNNPWAYLLDSTTYTVTNSTLTRTVRYPVFTRTFPSIQFLTQTATIDYEGLQVLTRSLTLNTGTHRNIDSVESLSVPTTIQAGASDAITVGPSLETLGLAVAGPHSGNHYYYSAAGQLTVNGHGGTLTLDDRGTQDYSSFVNGVDVRTHTSILFTIDNGTVTRTSQVHEVMMPQRVPPFLPPPHQTITDITNNATINYQNVSSLTIDGSSVNTNFTVASTAAATPVTINTGAGNDTVGVGRTALDPLGPRPLDAIQGTLSLNGQGGADVLNLNDQAASRGHTYTLNGGTVMRDGMANISSSGIATVNLSAGTGPDDFVMMPGAILSVINGGGGGDTLDYSHYNTGVNVNLGAYGGGTSGSATGVGSSVSNIQNVIGSPYNDVLIGNGNGNVLVGGGGSDVITGGTGRSVLIGGTGTATIHGNSGGDLIVRGSTSFDLNPTALDAIFAEWDSPDSFTQRKQYLGGPTGHLNGRYFLITTGPNRTVFDNGDPFTDVAGSNWVL